MIRWRRRRWVYIDLDVFMPGGHRAGHSTKEDPMPDPDWCYSKDDWE